MKLNDFLTKTNKPLPKQVRTISFVNETKEIELNSQISTLEIEVRRLHDMEDLYTQMLSKIEALQDQTKTSHIREDQLHEQITLLDADVQRGEEMKQERDAIEDSLKSFKSQYENRRNG